MCELALFAGAGGGILGGLLLGWRTVAAVELDAYCRSVLLARQRDGILPRFPIWDDVRTFDGRPWRGAVDVVSGGFPCQDISVAGKGAGLDGERSGLWAEYARVVREVRPRFVFVENSPALVVRGLGRVLADLAEMGMDAEWCVLGAADAGAPHLRERLWIAAAHSDGERLERRGAQEVYRERRVPWGENVRSLEDLLRRPDIPEPLFHGVAHGLAHRVERLRAIGNGQVPVVAALAWRTLAARAGGVG